MRVTKVQMMLCYVFFKLSKLTYFRKCTTILQEYSKFTFLFCFWGIILDSSGWEVFASSSFLRCSIPSKCVFLLPTLSLQRRNCSGSFKIIFNIWKWLLLITSWISMKHFHFLPGALVPILIIQPYSLHFSFQDGLGSDSFHSPWTQEYSYLFCLENKANQKIILLNFWSCPFCYKSCLIFTNTNPLN